MLKTNTARWRELRGDQLKREPCCRECAKRDRVRAACEVDHIDGDSGNNCPNNLQSLCTPCHSRKTCRENGGFGRPKAQP